MKETKGFKVGDKVRIVKKSGNWNCLGKMDKWLGHIMTIRKLFSDGCHLEECKGEFNGGEWLWNFECLELLGKPEPEMENITEYQGKKYREVKRVAEVGELIKIVDAETYSNCYESGDIFTVESSLKSLDNNREHISVTSFYEDIYTLEYVVLEPIEETKEFTLDDLKPCMVVKLRDGDFYLVSQTEFGLGLVYNNNFLYFDDYKKDLTRNTTRNNYDIVSVYGFRKDYMIYSLETTDIQRELLWKRTEKSAKDIEIEKIQSDIQKLQDKLEKLKG